MGEFAIFCCEITFWFCAPKILTTIYSCFAELFEISGEGWRFWDTMYSKYIYRWSGIVSRTALSATAVLCPALSLPCVPQSSAAVSARSVSRAGEILSASFDVRLSSPPYPSKEHATQTFLRRPRRRQRQRVRWIYCSCGDLNTPFGFRTLGPNFI